MSEAKAEYYPSKVDIILQNEMPTYCYILVAGSLVNIYILFKSYPLYKTY